MKLLPIVMAACMLWGVPVWAENAAPPCPLGEKTLLFRVVLQPHEQYIRSPDTDFPCTCPGGGGVTQMSPDLMIIEEWCDLLPGRVLPFQRHMRLPHCPPGTFVVGLNPDGTWQGCAVPGKQ